ncbi:TPA: DUF2612 domain-containing protein [Pasteurella multocida]|nr:DUF2612 domain-containing protein [Pasteurella multocida]
MSYSNLLIWQYRHKPRAVATIKLFEDILGSSFIELNNLKNILNIEESTGHQLDLVGKHVGQLRIINGYQLRKFFGFHTSQHALSFGRLNQNVGGQWYRRRDPLADSVRLSDEDYRFLIKCRILKNYQTGTLPNIIEACLFVFGEGCDVTDNYDMTVSISIPRTKMTDFKKFAVEHLDILPRQVGVKFNYSIQ